jgi:hypothetical protein
MDRRRFLLATASLSAAGLVGGFASPLRAAAANRAAPHQLLRLDAASQRFLPYVAAAEVQSAGALRLHIDAFLPAADSRLTSLHMEALFGEAQTPWRHLAWHYVQGDAFGSSRAAGFDLGAGVFRGLELSWQTNDATSGQSMQCVAAAQAGALAAGRYLLVLGDTAGFTGDLPFSGDARHPLTQASVDCFSLRVEAVQAVPDLAARADKACLACADEAIAA